jgi:hypothetical protein
VWAIDEHAFKCRSAYAGRSFSTSRHSRVNTRAGALSLACTRLFQVDSMKRGKESDPIKKMYHGACRPIGVNLEA